MDPLTFIEPTLHFSLLDDLTPSIMAARPSMALALGQQQVAGLARAATLEQLREKLETGGEGPERKMARLAEEQQRLMQQAFQHNLLAMASQMPMNLRLGAPAITTRGQCCQVCLHSVRRSWTWVQIHCVSICQNRYLV